jgi:hypothetical protein
MVLEWRTALHRLVTLTRGVRLILKLQHNGKSQASICLGAEASAAAIAELVEWMWKGNIQSSIIASPENQGGSHAQDARSPHCGFTDWFVGLWNSNLGGVSPFYT